MYPTSYLNVTSLQCLTASRLAMAENPTTTTTTRLIPPGTPTIQLVDLENSSFALFRLLIPAELTLQRAI